MRHRHSGRSERALRALAESFAGAGAHACFRSWLEALWDERQRRLAEISEMIHAASLLHDDVIDLADTRRGAKAAHKIYGNKVAVLAGDFLLARASVLLARLGDVRVVELLATVIEEMVQGEMMQVRANPTELLEFDHYLSKTYRKTAALMSLSCEAAGLLAVHPPEVVAAMQSYGRHLGICYQASASRQPSRRRAAAPPRRRAAARSRTAREAARRANARWCWSQRAADRGRLARLHRQRRRAGQARALGHGAGPRHRPHALRGRGVPAHPGERLPPPYCLPPGAPAAYARGRGAWGGGRGAWGVGCGAGCVVTGEDTCICMPVSARSRRMCLWPMSMSHVP